MIKKNITMQMFLFVYINFLVYKNYIFPYNKTYIIDTMYIYVIMEVKGMTDMLMEQATNVQIGRAHV